MRYSATRVSKRIGGVRFTLMDPTEIRRMSSVEVKTADTYGGDGHPYRQGLMDPHMGVIEPGLTCPTDNCRYDESPDISATYNLNYQLSTLVSST